MSSCIGVLRPEGGTEGVYVAQGTRVTLGFELPADSEKCGFAEEVLAVVDLPPTGPGWRSRVESRDPEHVAGPFGIVPGDDRRVQIQEATILVKAMGRGSQRVADPRDRPKGVGARPEMSQLTQAFE